jgi:hypothetical protein
MRGDGIVAKAARVVEVWDGDREVDSALAQALHELAFALGTLRQREREKIAAWRKRRETTDVPTD